MLILFRKIRKESQDGFCVSSKLFSVGHEQHALQLLALVGVSVRVFRAVAHARICDIIVFVWFSVRNLTL